MHCNELRERLDELWAGEHSAEVREHLTGCLACEGYLRKARLLRAGLLVLAEEPAPEPSVGFAARLVRALGKATEQGAAEEFLERVGRRFVYATSILTLIALLALILPSSGPVRGSATANLLVPQPEVVTAGLDPIGGDLQDSQDLAPVDVSGEDTKGKE
jgi:hypothetical protein